MIATDIVLLKKEEFRKRAADYNKECKAIDAKITAGKKKIEWHNRRIERLSAKRLSLQYPSWTEDNLRPVLDELVKLTPEIKWEFSRLNVFGLRGECPVFGKTKDNITVGITFTNNEEQLYYDTGETRNSYDNGTLGSINGFNNICAPVESMETLLNHISKGIEREKQEINKMPHEHT